MSGLISRQEGMEEMDGRVPLDLKDLLDQEVISIFKIF